MVNLVLQWFSTVLILPMIQNCSKTIENDVKCSKMTRKNNQIICITSNYVIMWF